MLCKGADEVANRALQFITCMEQITNPSEFGFKSHLSTPPFDAIVNHARENATCDSKSAVATLTIAPGSQNTFEIRGTHALGTVASTFNTRLPLLITTAILVIVAFLWLRQISRG